MWPVKLFNLELSPNQILKVAEVGEWTVWLVAVVLQRSKPMHRMHWPNSPCIALVVGKW